MGLRDNLNDRTGGTAAKAVRFTISYPAYAGATSYEVDRREAGGGFVEIFTTAGASKSQAAHHAASASTCATASGARASSS